MQDRPDGILGACLRQHAPSTPLTRNVRVAALKIRSSRLRFHQSGSYTQETFLSAPAAPQISPNQLMQPVWHAHKSNPNRQACQRPLSRVLHPYLLLVVRRLRWACTMRPISAHPASTPLPLTHREPSYPPLQPLKSHQTGSCNPFGVPKASSPSPLPRAPTLFELTSGVPQPPPQSQGPAQVKPQQTGLPAPWSTRIALILAVTLVLALALAVVVAPLGSLIVLLTFAIILAFAIVRA